MCTHATASCFLKNVFTGHITTAEVSAVGGVDLKETTFAGGFDFQADARDYDVRSLSLVDKKSSRHAETINRVLFQHFSNWEHVSWKYSGEQPRPVYDSHASRCPTPPIWQLIRTIHETPILTRVSVISLLAIPVIAAIWNAINQNTDIGILLPTSLSIAFLASLLYFVGYSLFKAFCPTTVFSYSRGEFVEKRVAETVDDSRGTAELRRSINAISVQIAQSSEGSARFVDYHGEAVWIPDTTRIDCLVRDLPDYSNARTGEGEPSRFFLSFRDRRRIIGEIGAICEYDRECRRRLAVGVAVGVLYVLSLFSLVVVAVLQILAVLQASGLSI